jgi:hypothetical protein
MFIYNFGNYFQSSNFNHLSLFRKINSVFKWWGVTRKSLASLFFFLKMKTYVQCNIQWQKTRSTMWKQQAHRYFLHITSTYLLSMYRMIHVCINFQKTVRVLQNNERSFPLIFTISVVEYNLRFHNSKISNNPFYN